MGVGLAKQQYLQSPKQQAHEYWWQVKLGEVYMGSYAEL